MTTGAGGAGFTGVEWELRTPEDLARALTAGPGPGQAGELAAVWEAAAAELDAVASEYRRLAVELSAEWVSQATPGLDDRSREVSEDVHALAVRAHDVASRAAGHAHAHAVARSAMPRAEETALTARTLDALDSLGPGLAGALSGTTTALEDSLAENRRAAARVMAEYENRTAPLAEPSERAVAPRRLLPGLVAPTTADGTAPVETGAPPPSVTLPVVSLAVPATAPVAVAPPGAQVRPAATGGATPAPAPVEPRPVEARADRMTGAGMPLAPLGAAAGATTASDDEHHPALSVRPGIGAAEVEDLYGLAVAVAPSVLGGGDVGTADLTPAVRGTS